MKYTLKIFVTLITVIIIAHGFTSILSRINILDSITTSISDIDITDIYFSSGFSYKDKNVDKDIVLINFGVLDRSGIAQLINNINKHNPKVIGMDTFFSTRKDSIRDYMLRDAFQNTNNLVLAVQIENNEFTRSSDPFFITKNSKLGYLNLQGTNAYMARKFPHHLIVENETYLPFAAKIAGIYNPNTIDSYSNRTNRDEYIYYSGYFEDSQGFRKGVNQTDNVFLNSFIKKSNKSLSRFRVLDWEAVLNGDFNSSDIKGKIVIIGAMGRYLYDPFYTEDSFYSPLNPNLFSSFKSPDMYGLEIHANIISMILNNEMISHGQVINFLFGLLIMIGSVVFYNSVYVKYHNKYQLIAKLSLILQLNLLIALCLILFHYFKLKIDINYLLLYLLLLPDTIEILGSFRVYKKLS